MIAYRISPPDQPFGTCTRCGENEEDHRAKCGVCGQPRFKCPHIDAPGTRITRYPHVLCPDGKGEYDGD